MAMEFGIQFFPCVGPAEKSAADYWGEALHLVGLADELGFTSVRTVEHYFHPYGGYSPNPVVFLAAAAMRTRRARLVTGAVLPAFNNPLKVAGELAMLDAISGGRLEAGFARAFLPHEFSAFGVPLDESRTRYGEGVEQVRRLLEDEVASHRGDFHAFTDLTSLPRPTQRPRPPFWVAALATPASFEWAGRNGHGVMAIPMAGGAMAGLIETYREAWRASGHPGEGRVMLAFHMFCDHDRKRAAEIAKPNLEAYLRRLVDGARHWLDGENSADYPGYAEIIASLDAETFESQVEKGAAWVGTPDDIAEGARAYHASVGGFEIASFQVNFFQIGVEDAEASMRTFAADVPERLAGLM